MAEQNQRRVSSQRLIWNGRAIHADEPTGQRRVRDDGRLDSFGLLVEVEIERADDDACVR